MVKWPEHSEAVRDDELYLFAYCTTRWSDDPYVYRSSDQYEEVTKSLNERFSSRFGPYSANAVRRYIQELNSDPHYRWPSSRRKRFHQFEPEIEAYIDANRAIFGPYPRAIKHIPLSAKRKCNGVSNGDMHLIIDSMC